MSIDPDQYSLLYERGVIVEVLPQYCITVISAALLCCLIMDFMKNCRAKKQIKILCGLVITITILAPLSRLNISSFMESIPFCVDSINTATQEGERMARNALALRIKEEAESYILSEAEKMNAELTVTVTLSEEEIPVPVSVSVRGQVAPAARQHLKEILENDLGIPREMQVWTG